MTHEMTPAELVDILKKHERWVNGWAGGVRANLSNQDLSGVRLPRITLRGAVLAGTNFQDAVLKGCDLREADLYGSNLSNADLSEANLEGASLRGAKLGGANLTDANLHKVDLRQGTLMINNGPKAACSPMSGIGGKADLPL